MEMVALEVTGTRKSSDLTRAQGVCRLESIHPVTVPGSCRSRIGSIQPQSQGTHLGSKVLASAFHLFVYFAEHRLPKDTWPE